MVYLRKLRKLVKEGLKSDKTGHDANHTFRVLKMALYLAKFEKNVDLGVLKAAALLHDIAYSKGSFKGEHGDISAKIAKKILEKLDFPKDKIPKVLEAIKLHNWFFHFEKNVPIEIKILRDADRLDGLGSYGIKRSILFYGKENLIKGLKRNIRCTENHFETKKGKELGIKRIKVLRRYIKKHSSG